MAVREVVGWLAAAQTAAKVKGKGVVHFAPRLRYKGVTPMDSTTPSVESSSRIVSASLPHYPYQCCRSPSSPTLCSSWKSFTMQVNMKRRRSQGDQSEEGGDEVGDGDHCNQCMRRRGGE